MVLQSTWLTQAVRPCAQQIATCCAAPSSTVTIHGAAHVHVHLCRRRNAAQPHSGVFAGIFFLGYAVLQVPSNLILLRVGAPTWLGVTIVAWGTVAALFAALRNTADFYILRFLLGITECGAFPGVWDTFKQLDHNAIMRWPRLRQVLCLTK